MENYELIRQDYLKLEKAFLEVCGEKDLPEYRERIAAYVLRVLSADPVYHKECEDVLATGCYGGRHRGFSRFICVFEYRRSEEKRRHDDR